MEEKLNKTSLQEEWIRSKCGLRSHRRREDQTGTNNISGRRKNQMGPCPPGGGKKEQPMLEN